MAVHDIEEHVYFSTFKHALHSSFAKNLIDRVVIKCVNNRTVSFDDDYYYPLV
jgi:hypothetical protein